LINLETRVNAALHDADLSVEWACDMKGLQGWQ
jgi:hypothetical protein